MFNFVNQSLPGDFRNTIASKGVTYRITLTLNSVSSTAGPYYVRVLDQAAQILESTIDELYPVPTTLSINHTVAGSGNLRLIFFPNGTRSAQATLSIKEIL